MLMGKKYCKECGNLTHIQGKLKIQPDKTTLALIGVSAFIFTILALVKRSV